VRGPAAERSSAWDAVRRSLDSSGIAGRRRVRTARSAVLAACRAEMIAGRDGPEIDTFALEVKSCESGSSSGRHGTTAYNPPRNPNARLTDGSFADPRRC